MSEPEPQQICSKCGQEAALPGQRWGRKCRAAYARERRKATVRVPGEFVVRGTLDANGRVRVAAVRKAQGRLAKTETRRQSAAATGKAAKL